MLLILLGVLILHLIILVLLFVSTIANAWTVGGTKSSYLWFSCLTTNGGYHCIPASNEDWIQAVQALMVLSVLFCLFSLVFFMCQLFTLVKGGRFFFTAIFQILASLFVMCGAIIYTVMSPDGEVDAALGFAYVLAWVSFPLCLVSGLIYMVLRKRE
ncbi:peripheral myelin protein 22-like [Coregonus clupeaformis]|uniref:peripheral myelin protein 22-like n=1 Tax=Coregonus clupeaformis TaxID=59861 RepID=UPI001BDF967C|nr:peripheral myelin protein 22-like [Coregonus clupeaformis]